MPIRLSNLRLGVEESEQALAGQLARALDVRPDQIERWRILRKSLDARDKRNLNFVYSAEVVVPEDEAELVQRVGRRHSGIQAELFAEPPFVMPPAGSEPLAERPIVVGSGPAGLAAAYFLAEQGYRPLVLERGRKVRERIADVRDLEAGGPLNPESNYLFGEGGAGTFSDGKLTCRASGPDLQRVLQLLADCKGKPSILYEQRPHLGSNRLPAVVKALRQRIEQFGGELRFDCRVEDFDVADGAIRGLSTSSGYLPAGVVILAIGHSARDTLAALLARGVAMVQKPFQLGVRIEQPQEQVNRVQYGERPLEDLLGAADYSLVARGGKDLFTFCMCAGGQVIPSISEPGHFCTNGMSLSKRGSRFANSGLMITLEPHEFGGDDPLAGVRVQQHYEALAYSIGRGEYLAPIQRVADFLAGRPTKDRPESSCHRGVVPAEIAGLVPPQVVEALKRGLPALDKRWHGLFLANATLVAPESRGSSPVRLTRDAVTLESTSTARLYPIGEGAGFAGGIVSAAMDGLRAAKAVIARYAALDQR